MLAQLQVDPMNLGVFIVCLMALFFAANQITGTMANLKKLRELPVKHGDLYVTHAQFDSFKAEYKLEATTFRQAIKDDLAAAAKDRKQELHDLSLSTRESIHRIGNAQQTMTADLAWIKGVMQGRQEAKGAPHE